MAAPIGNFNRLTTGVSAVVDKAPRYGLPSCRLPDEDGGIDHRIDTMRLAYEQATLRRYGEVSETHGTLIGEMTDHERARQFLYSRLRDCEAKERLPILTLCRVFEVIGKCARLRTECVKALKLDEHEPRFIPNLLYTDDPEGEPDASDLHDSDQSNGDAETQPEAPQGPLPTAEPPAEPIGDSIGDGTDSSGLVGTGALVESGTEPRLSGDPANGQ